MQKFVIISVPRTGSTLLVNLLNAHEDIYCAHEIFWRTSPLPGQLGVAVSRWHNNPTASMQLLFEKCKDYKAVGFKLFRHQNDKAWDAVLRDSSIKKIILTRKNVLDQYISEQLLAKSGLAHNPKVGFQGPLWGLGGRIGFVRDQLRESSRLLTGVAPFRKGGYTASRRMLRWAWRRLKSIQFAFVPYRIVPFPIRTEDVVRFSDRQNQFFDGIASHLELNNQRALEITYEELIANQKTTTARILDFLNVPFLDLSCSMERLNHEDKAGCVKNYSQVKTNLEELGVLDSKTHDTES